MDNNGFISAADMPPWTVEDAAKRREEIAKPIPLRRESPPDALVTLVYQGHRKAALDAAVAMFDVSPIVKRCGTWAVTSYGIECLSHYYPIEVKRLWGAHLVSHMWSKTWVNQQDFRTALHFGKEYHPKPAVRQTMRKALERVAKPPKPPKPAKVPKPRKEPEMTYSLRFQVMQRDGFRCRLCGATAADGVKLELDHKIPRAKGGTNHMDNLWVLCLPCNRGKHVRSVIVPGDGELEDVDDIPF